MKLEREFEDYEVVDGIAYVFSKRSNALYSIDLENNQAYFLGGVPSERVDGIRLYASLIHYCGKIYLIPCNAHSIAIYDIDRKIFSEIPLEHPDMSFMSYTLWGDYIVMFGFKCSFILRLNIHTNVVDYKEIVIENRVSEEVLFRKQNCLVNDKIVIPFYSKDAFLVFSPKDMTYEIIDIGIGNRGYSGVVYQCGKLYFAPRYKGETIVSFEYPCKELKDIIKKTKTGSSISIYSFVGMVIENENIILYTISEDKETDYYVDKFKINCGNYCCAYMSAVETKIYNYISGWIQIKNDTGEFVKKSVDLEVDVDSIYKNGGLIAQESGRDNLAQYLDMLINEECLSK